MKQTLLLLLVSILVSSIGFCQQTEKDTILVFYLGGQSNMDGHGYNSDLPDSLKSKFKNVWIYHGNPASDENIHGGWGKWAILQPGHGVGFSSDGSNNNLSDRFGIELSFAKTIQELHPNKKIALIKYSRGGTSIDSLAAGMFGSWDVDYVGSNGINQYDHFLATLKGAFSTNDIDSNGREDYLIPYGIIWMQGESDASYTEEIANNYYGNVKRLMDLIRASLLTDDLPVVLGKISDAFTDQGGKVWDYGELVQYAQEKYATLDGNAAIVRSTRFYKYSDPWHYDSNGYIDLGIKFAEAVYLLNNQ